MMVRLNFNEWFDMIDLLADKPPANRLPDIRHIGVNGAAHNMEQKGILSV
jgi:hypothetical protein